MANKYSKSNKTTGNKNAEKSMKKYDDQRKRLSTTAKIMAIVVSIAMIVTTFLASGVFFLD